MKLLSSNHFINAALAIAFFTITFVFVLSVYQSQKIKDTNEMVNHTQLVIQQVQRITITAMDLQAGARGYVMTGNNSYVEQLNNAEDHLPSSMAALRSLITDNPAQLMLFDSLRVYLSWREDVSNKMILLRQQNKIAEANEIVASGVGKHFTDRIRITGKAMEDIENGLLQKRKKLNDESIKNFNTLLYSVLIIVLFMSLLLFYKTKSSFEDQKLNEEKFRALLDAAPDAMVIADEHGIIKMINLQTSKIFGYSAAELLGQPVEILMPDAIRLQHQQSRNAFRSNPHVRTMREGADMVGLRKDGSGFPVEISLSPIRTSEGMLVSASVRDITQRKKAQQQFEVLLQQVNQSNDAIFTVDANLIITNWNLGAEKLYGFTKEEAIGKSSSHFLRMDLNDAEKEAIRATVDSEGYWTGEVRRYGKNDVIVDVISSITAIRNKEDVITGYISVSYDIGVQKKLREEITHLARLVEHSSEAIMSRGADKRLISWNEGAKEMLGYTKEEVIGKTATELGIIRFTPEEFKEVDSSLIIKGKWQGEKTFYRKNGESFTGVVAANAIKNNAGDITSEVFIVRDISLRKQFEEYLKTYNEKLEIEVQERITDIQKTEKRFKAMIENSNDLISVMDANRKIIYRSPAAERLTGRSNGEVYDLDTFKTLFDDEGFKEMQGHIQKAKENPGVPVYSPFRIVKKEGGFKYMEGTVTNFLHDENIKAIVFNARDITERKKAEEELMASEKRYREALDNMMEGIQILNKDLRYLYVNDAVAKQAGQSREELTGKLVTELYPGVEQTELYRNICRCIHEQVVIQLEDKFVFPDKTTKYFQMSLQPVPEGIFILSVDITDKKKTEKDLLKSLQEEELLANKLSVILNTLPATIALLDAEGVIADVNDGWKKFADDNNFRENSYGIGSNYIDICENTFGEELESAKTVADGLRAVLEHHMNKFEFEYPCHYPDGERWFRMIVSPLQQKTYHGAVVMHIDITELKRLEKERLKTKIEEQRNITRAMLEGQEKERNQIGRDLHDNIVQLMAATKMKLGIFLSQHSDGAPILNQSMDHLQEALTETRNLSHQMVTPRFASGTFTAELKRLLSDYSNDTRTADLHISNIDESVIPVRVKETLYRVAQEQLNNIDKYAQATEVSLELKIQGGNIYMTISDNGVGFDTAQQRKGIGLTNIYNRAESYSGHAVITSQPGNGCKLYIEIPL